LNTGFGLLAELLSFAWPKESSQRKGEPIAFCVWLAAGFFFLPQGLRLPRALLFFASPKKR
jgi:hypothetical protein